MLVPANSTQNKPRPKVGKIKGKPFESPLAAFVPLNDEELKERGL